MLIPCDTTGVFLTRIFHIYQRKVGKTGVFCKTSVRLTKPKCRIKKGKKYKNFIVRSVYPLLLKDGSYYSYINNASVLIKKRLTMKGRVVFGPTTYHIKKKKFLKSFAKVL